MTSATGTAYAVFLLPAYEERTGEGTGGGPGLGYRLSDAGRSAFVSYDGLQWDRIHRSLDLAVDAITGVAKGSQPLVLSKIGDRLDLSRTEGVPERTTPTRTWLAEPVPNPFNPSVELHFDLDRRGPVRLRIYNVRGQLVQTLVKESLTAGSHVRVWHGTDARGRSVASGVYYARLEVDGQRHERTMALVR